MTTTTITAADATNGLVQTGGNDGTLTLRTGPSGGKVNALSFASDGTPTFLKGPLASMVRLNTTNGYGSTNTCIKRFTTTTTNQGTDITYADSATLGATLTVNTSGVYAISYTDQCNTASTIGISLNSAQLSTFVLSITAGTSLAAATSAFAGYVASVSWTGYLPAGSVIRPHGDGALTGVNPNVGTFTITRVA